MDMQAFLGERHFTGPQVLKRYGISEMTLHRWIKSTEVALPAPTYIGRRRYWQVDELLAWEKSKKVFAEETQEAEDNSIPLAKLSPEFIAKALNAHDDLVAALKQSMTAIDDWLNIFAEDLCNEERVAEARARVSAGGTLWYIATVQEINRNALKLAGVK